MVSSPVCLGIKHTSGAYNQIFTTVRQLRLCCCGAFSLMRGQVCRLQLLLVLASAVILGSESHGNRDHILLSQIRPRFHMGWTAFSSKSKSKLLYDWHFTAHQLALALSSLRPTTRDFFPQLNPCGISPYVTSSVMRILVCLL
jgi:hypothetical protein